MPQVNLTKIRKFNIIFLMKISQKFSSRLALKLMIKFIIKIMNVVLQDKFTFSTVMTLIIRSYIQGFSECNLKKRRVFYNKCIKIVKMVKVMINLKILSQNLLDNIVMVNTIMHIVFKEVLDFSINLIEMKIMF